MTKDAHWVDHFTGLSGLDPAAQKLLLERSNIVEVAANQPVFQPGHSPQNMLLLLEGTVRVQQTSEAGHEIVLYRIEAGQTCILTSACLLACEDYSAEGITETSVKAVAIPRELFDNLMAQSTVFRGFVFEAFSKRFTDLFSMIDEVAFQRLDVRLSDRLTKLSDSEDNIATTHQKLAAELGTAREVISRQLQEFQRRGWIEQSRGNIRLLDKTAITNLASKNL